MKKVIKWIDNLLYEYGWFAIIVLIIAIIALILALSSVITPFLNSIIWGMD